MVKEEIRSYRQYKAYRKRLNDRLDTLWYELTGVKGIRYDKAHFNADPAVSEEKRLALLDKVTLVETELDRVEKQIGRIDKLLSVMPNEDRKLVEYTLIDGNTYRQAENIFYITYPTVSRRIDRIIENAMRCMD